MDSKPQQHQLANYSVTHAFVYGRVRQKIRGNITDRKNILEVLRFIIRIPGPHQQDFLDEMTENSDKVIVPLFRRLSRDKYEILHKKLQVPKDFYGLPLWN